MPARALLEIAADYAEARQTIALNPDLITDADGEAKLDELADKFEDGLRSFIANPELSPDTGRVRAYYCTECGWAGLDVSQHNFPSCDETAFGMTWADADQS